MHMPDEDRLSAIANKVLRNEILNTRDRSVDGTIISIYGLNMTLKEQNVCLGSEISPRV